jgi:hypothetical protein
MESGAELKTRASAQKSLHILTAMVENGVTMYDPSGMQKVCKLTRSKPSLVSYYAIKYHKMFESAALAKATIQKAIDAKLEAQKETNYLRTVISSLCPSFNQTPLPTAEEWRRADELSMMHESERLGSNASDH